MIRIHTGGKWAPLIADLFLYCQAMKGILYLTFTGKSKRLDLKDMLYLMIPLAVLTIYSPSITLNLSKFYIELTIFSLINEETPLFGFNTAFTFRSWFDLLGITPVSWNWPTLNGTLVFRWDSICRWRSNRITNFIMFMRYEAGSVYLLINGSCKCMTSRLQIELICL